MSITESQLHGALEPGTKAFTLGAPGPRSVVTITAIKVGSPIKLQ